MLFSVTMLPSAVIAWVYREPVIDAFLSSFTLVFLVGALLWLPARKANADLRTRDGFLIVALFWVVLGLFGATPLLLAELPSLTFTQAVFESFSGLTTTGATVIEGLDDLPKAILFYRQQLQWLGGMGIIVLAVAILPMLGVGGMQLYRAETPGPMKDSKLTPRIAETAKALWYIYLSLTVACGIAYWFAGMTPFDAIGHAFSTIAIGGFSTHDASIGYFNSAAIESIAIVFMLIAGVNFALHFTVWRGVNPLIYLRDPEVQGFFKVIGVVSLVVALVLVNASFYPTAMENIRHAVFHTVSIVTTTGFATHSFDVWPGVLPTLLIMASCIGGCAGSTAGGMKVIRAQLVRRQVQREVMQLIHPQAKLPIKLGGRTIPLRVMTSVMSFLAAYVILYMLLMVAFITTGMDQRTAFSAVAASLNNLGPGLGQISSTSASASPAAQWIMVFAMLLGRLEIFSLLVLLSPAFWRR